MRHEIILQDPAAGIQFFHSHSSGNSVTPHWHHSLEILYLHSGSLRVDYPDHSETVQAAIGSVPLAMGLSCGNIVLSVAVLAIIITAPLGAFGIDFSYKRLLEKEK